MTMQNVTIALPEEVIKAAKHIAVDRGMSLSALVAEYITEITKQQNVYRHAQKEALSLLSQGYDLGTGGKVDCKREELHER